MEICNNKHNNNQALTPPQKLDPIQQTQQKNMSFSNQNDMQSDMHIKDKTNNTKNWTDHKGWEITSDEDKNQELMKRTTKERLRSLILKLHHFLNHHYEGNDGKTQ